MSFEDWQKENKALALQEPSGFEAWQEENKALNLQEPEPISKKGVGEVLKEEFTTEKLATKIPIVGGVIDLDGLMCR